MARGDGADVVDAAEAEGDQEGERGFGAVGGGAEGIETEDGDAGGGTDVLGAFFRCGQRSSEQQVSDLHEGSRSRGLRRRCYLRCVAKK